MNKTYLLISHTSDRHATRHQPRTHECRRAASARPRLFLSGSDLLSSKGLLLSLHRGESALAGSLSQPQVTRPWLSAGKSSADPQSPLQQATATLPSSQGLRVVGPSALLVQSVTPQCCSTGRWCLAPSTAHVFSPLQWRR